jgi:hypothetical protein
MTENKTETKRGIGNCINCLEPYNSKFKTFMTGAMDYFGTCESCGQLIYLMNDLQVEMNNTKDPDQQDRISKEMAELTNQFNKRSK